MMTQQEIEALTAELSAIGAQTCNLGEKQIYLSQALHKLHYEKALLSQRVDEIMANLMNVKNVLSDEEKAS